MSEQTKRHAQTTDYNLRKAEEYMVDAVRSAKNTGDKKLIEKVTQIRNTVTDTRKELNTKLNEG